MRREIEVLRLAQCGNLQKTGDAAAACRVGLQDIHGRLGEEATEIIEVVAILPGGDVHPSRRARPHQREPVDIVRAQRFLKPCNIVFRDALGQRQRVFRRERAIGIDEQTGIPDRVACAGHALWVARRVAADFHFDPATAIVLDPAGKLLAQPRIGVAGEPATAIDRHGIAAAPKKRGRRNPEKLGFHVP